MQFITYNLQELHTFNSYLVKDVLNDCMTIYMVNAGISNHSINPSDQIKYINKSYLICESPVYLKINLDVIIDKPSDFTAFYFGGWDIIERKHIEVEVKASKIYLVLLNDSILSTEQFYPIDSPNFKQNMDTGELIRFFASKISAADLPNV